MKIIYLLTQMYSYLHRINYFFYLLLFNNLFLKVFKYSISPPYKKQLWWLMDISNYLRHQGFACLGQNLKNRKRLL